MRPVFFEESDNLELLQNASTYLWGNNFLITPIVNPEVKEKEVYFPKNNTWFNFYTDKKTEGGQTKTVDTKENSIPTYVRAGAFIPMAKLVQSTEDYSLSNLDLHYYHDTSISQSKGQVYNDDGITPNAFEKGKYELLHFKSEACKKSLEIAFKAEIGNQYTSQEKQINLIIHNIGKTPRYIKVNGKRKMFDLKNQGKNIVIPITWNTSKEIKVKIKF